MILALLYSKSLDLSKLSDYDWFLFLLDYSVLNGFVGELDGDYHAMMFYIALFIEFSPDAASKFTAS